MNEITSNMESTFEAMSSEYRDFIDSGGTPDNWEPW
jgi:hypothetical protein